MIDFAEALSADYRAAVERLPENLRRRASEFMSERRESGQWVVRDASGSVLNPAVPPAPPTKPKFDQAAFKQLLVAEIVGLLKPVFRDIQADVELIDKAIGSISARLKAVEEGPATKSLDVAAYDSLVELAERVDRAEKTLADVINSGFRYRGYWREGVHAQRGEAYTNDGSLWWAVRDTDEKPCRESLDWQVAVRKGQDAK